MTLFWSILIIFSIFNEKRWKRSKSGFSGFPFFSVFLQSQGISGGEKVVFSVSWGVPHGSEKVMFLTTRNNQKINEKSIFIKMIKNQWKIDQKSSKNQSKINEKMTKNDQKRGSSYEYENRFRFYKSVKKRAWTSDLRALVSNQPKLATVGSCPSNPKKKPALFLCFWTWIWIAVCEIRVKNKALYVFFIFFFFKADW